MTTTLIIAAGYLLAGIALGFAIARGIRIADEALEKCPDVPPLWLLNGTDPA